MKLPLKSWVAYYVLVVLAILAPFSWATIVGSLPYTLTNGTTADATHVMANYQKIIDDVNANAAANGANSDITALLGLTTPIAPASGGTNHFPGGTTTGTANAQVLATTIPDTFTLTAGYSVTFTAGFTNTSTTTLNVNATGATNVFKTSVAGPVALGGGEIVAGNKITVVYDGTQYQLIAPGRQQYGVLTNLSSAGGTPDLGTVLSHNVNITGTTTITSFGSSASTTDPFYKLTFAGALTLTHNGTSLILPGGQNITTAANASAEVVYLGSGNWRMTQYQQPSVYPGSGQLARVNIYTSNDTWTLGAGERSVFFKCGGGGGAGGGSGNTGAGQTSAGAGGGAGGYSEVYITAPAASYALTIGAAGVGSAGTTGGNGGNTTVGAVLTCNGGNGGTTIGVGASTARTSGGTGGAASGGTLNVAGHAGADAFVSADAGPNYYAFSGSGGNNPIAVGGTGSILMTGDATGGTGSTCGGGGGGAASVLAGGTSHAGADGGGGCVIAYTYY